MKAPEHKQMMIYRLNVIIGNRIRLMQVAGWSDSDAEYRAGQRLISEGHETYTLAILERRPL